MKRLNNLPVLRMCAFWMLMPVWVLIAEEIVFPGNTEGVINVVDKYDIDNSGRTDVTAKLQRALNENQDWKVLYLPKGTYLVSNTIKGKICAKRGYSSFGPILTGESREGTVIKLKDGTWPEDKINIKDYPKNPTDQVVLHSGDCTNTTFKKAFRNFTINIGKNNAGAIGLVFVASNSGLVADVNIVSEDGQGSIGLSLTGVENGPSSARSIYVRGFKRGVYAATGVLMSMSQVTVEGATEYGFVNRWACAVDSLLIRTSGRAILNNRDGRLSVLNGNFIGNGSDTVAVENWGKGYFQNIKISDFKHFHNPPLYEQNPAPDGPSIEEYASHENQGLFYSPKRSMRIPIEYPPMPKRETNLSRWANVDSYKASGVSDEQAMIKAFNESGVTSVFFPKSGTNRLQNDITLPGKIAWVEGGGGKILGGRKIGSLTISNGSAPVVVLRNMDLRNNQDRKTIGFVINTSRTVILESVYGNVTVKGTGKVFIYDLLGKVEVDNPQAKVWVRKINQEYRGGIVVKRGTLWALGFKSEGFQNDPKVLVQAGGTCEIFSFLNYNCGHALPAGFNQALFKVVDGNFAVANIQQQGCNSPVYDKLVIETRKGVTRTYTSEMNQEAGGTTLYTGYDPSNFQIDAKRKKAKAPGGPQKISIESLGPRAFRISFDPASSGALLAVTMSDATGRTYPVRIETDAGPKARSASVDVSSFSTGVYFLNVKWASKSFSRRIVVK